MEIRYSIALSPVHAASLKRETEGVDLSEGQAFDPTVTVAGFQCSHLPLFCYLYLEVVKDKLPGLRSCTRKLRALGALPRGCARMRVGVGYLLHKFNLV